MALQPHVEPPAHELVVQVPAHVVVETAQDLLAAVRQRDLGAEAVEDPAELDGDEAPADDQHATRQLGQLKRLVRGDRQLGAAIVVDRLPAGGDQDVRSREAAPPTLDRVTVGQRGVTLDEGDAGRLEQSR